ncbi:MAG: hypothetical protein ACRDQ5_25400 [Sciscionella sp.]
MSSARHGGRHRERRQHADTRIALGAALTGAAIAITGQSVYLGPTSAYLSDTKEVAEFRFEAVSDHGRQAGESASEERKSRAAGHSSDGTESPAAVDALGQSPISGDDSSGVSAAGPDSSGSGAGPDESTVELTPGVEAPAPSTPAPSTPAPSTPAPSGADKPSARWSVSGELPLDSVGQAAPPTGE